MTATDADDGAKIILHGYLRRQRDSLVRKLDGLAEYDRRRPMTPTGTNLLGLVKHVAGVQLGYLGEVFGRPVDRSLPWLDEGAEPDADLWAPAEQSSDEILELHFLSAAHADETIRSLPLTAPGQVPWWAEERRAVTLHQILVHLCVETSRHAGHADVIRELIDGVAGAAPDDPNLPGRTADEWADHRARIEHEARSAGG